MPGILLREGLRFARGVKWLFNGISIPTVTTQLGNYPNALRFLFRQLTGDLSQVNYSSYRAGHLEFRGLVDAFRWVTLVLMLCKPVWNRFIETAYNAKVIPAQRYDSKWIPPAYQSSTLSRMRTPT